MLSICKYERTEKFTSVENNRTIKSKRKYIKKN